MAGKCKKWEIWTADVKFEETNEIKRRPVLITQTGNDIYVLCVKITKHGPRYQFDGEYRIQQWKNAGLHLQSTIRFSKMFRMRETDLKFKIGKLHPVDIVNAEGILDRLKSKNT